MRLFKQSSLLPLLLFGLFLTSCASSGNPMLEVIPKHFQLRPGEQIHYSLLERSENGSPKFVDYELLIEHPAIVRRAGPKQVIEAVTPGRTLLVMRTPNAEQRVSIEVTGAAQPPLNAVHHSTIREITARELLFVGHANMDGFDHTGVAKTGIDRLVREAKRKGWPVVYFVSQEYPNWYTADRNPDYAIVSEGQEHEIRVDAERVVFTGGSFMFCTLRNVQMTLHGMAMHGKERVQFVFPAAAIWVEDLWGPGEKPQPPAPMVLLTRFFARRANDIKAYEEVVVPFLDRMIKQFPVAGYPSNAPSPALDVLLKDWSIVVRFSDRFERVYQSGTSGKTLLLEFQDV